MVVCGGSGERVDKPAPGDGSSCTVSGRRRRGTGGGDEWLTDLDRPKRGEDGEEAGAAAVEPLVYSARADLRFGCTGGGRSVVGREVDGERDREGELTRGRDGDCERRRDLRLAPATCSKERVDVTDAGGLIPRRGGRTGIVLPVPSKDERELPLPAPARIGGLTACVELLRTCKTRSCSRCASIRFASWPALLACNDCCMRVVVICGTFVGSWGGSGLGAAPLDVGTRTGSERGGRTGGTLRGGRGGSLRSGEGLDLAATVAARVTNGLDE
jgi:hypothetical protein